MRNIVAVLATTLIALLSLAVYLWVQASRPATRLEITETEALDALSAGFEWEHTHPGYLTFTLSDGREVRLEGGFAPPARWFVPRGGVEG